MKFIKKLIESGKVTNLNQIAFLFNSVRSEKPMKLANYLEQNDINIYSPRSNMFFNHEEIMLSLGLLILAFPNYAKNLSRRDFKFVDEELCDYYENCVKETSAYLRQHRIYPYQANKI